MTQPSMFDNPGVLGQIEYLYPPDSGVTIVLTPTPVAVELQRRESNRDRVLARLRQGPATTMQLIEVGGTRAPARCHELNKRGYVVTSTHVDGGLWVYALVSEPEPKS